MTAFMWHDRNNRIGQALVACAIALVSVSSCTPDAPEGGPPTHPTEGFSLTLEWNAPTTDAVGRPLDDLAEYRLYYSPDPPSVVAPAASLSGESCVDSTRTGLRQIATLNFTWGMAMKSYSRFNAGSNIRCNPGVIQMCGVNCILQYVSNPY